MMSFHGWLAAFLAFHLGASAMSSDTLLLPIAEARSRLLDKNLGLLAERFNVADAEAAALQAKLWNNPTFVYNADMYSIERNDYMNFRNQVLIQLEMMVPLSGRIARAGRVADLDVRISELELQDYLRELIYDFNLEYHHAALEQQRARHYAAAAETYDRLIASAEMHDAVGSISGSELMRLRSERLSLQAQMLENVNEIETAMATLRTLLHLPPHVYLQLVINEDPPAPVPPLDQLGTMIASRPDVRAALLKVDRSEADLKLQKALMMPDVKMGYQPLDRGSNYVRPYQGVVLELPLLVFNRNQGSIRSARNGIHRSRLELLELENRSMNELQSIHQQLERSITMLQAYTPELLDQLEELNTEATRNYNARNLTILEYIDLQRIHLQTMEDLLTVKGIYLMAKEALDHSTGQTILK